MLELKGINYRELDGWGELTEVDQYRIAENSSDVNVWKHIFSKILDIEEKNKK
ncbi:hypothetical protein D3C75_1339870 [compost metagenome]